MSKRTSSSRRRQSKSSSSGSIGPPPNARPNVHLKSCLALAVICEPHQKIGLRPIPGKPVNWFPFGAIGDEDHWQSAAESFAERLLGSKVSVKFTNAYHTQVSRKGVWLKRIIFTALLKGQSGACCEKVKTLSWFPVKEVIENIDDNRIWGSEPSFYAYTYVKKLGIKIFLESNLKEAIEIYPPKNGTNKNHQMILKSGMSMDDAVILAEEFYSHVYPSQNMNLPSFTEYFGLTGWSSDRQTLAKIYNSFRTYEQDVVRLNAFIYGIAAYSPSVPQAGVTGAARNLYIFRYFDENRSGFLEFNEFYNMRREVMNLNKQASGNPVDLIVNELSYDYEAVRSPFGSTVSFDKFKGAIGDMKLRGTSSLCRSRVPIRGARLYNSEQVMALSGDSSAVLCKRHGKVNYTVEAYEVMIDGAGRVRGTKPVPQNVLNTLTMQQKFYSDLLLSENSPHKCISMVHHHAEAMGFYEKSHINRHDWQQLPDDKFQERVAIIQETLKRAKEIFIREPSVVKISSPVYVLGDIHGNLSDLMTFERVLWKKGPCEGGNFLFLGDYVDRGKDSMECILYLLAMKIMNPQKFTLLRGNHETRSLQKSFTFQKEVQKKLSRNGKLHDFSNEMWDKFNDVFDSVPICAIIDDSIFCAHGGIPFSASKTEHLLSIPKQMPDPENESAAAWEILWSDPMEQALALESINLTSSGSKHSHLEQLRGYLKNEKRGTAYLFTDIAVDNFLRGNNLSHIIRAHEVINDGYRYQMGGKVTTVFSSSRYCGLPNKAACILVQDKKMRVIRIDT